MKYVIEIDDKPFVQQTSFGEIKLYRGEGYKGPVFTESDMNELEILNDVYVANHFSDMLDNAYAHGKSDAEADYHKAKEERDRIVQECIDKAYQKGLKDGYKNGVSVGENSANDKLTEQYEKGLMDAWEASRKIAMDDQDGGYAIDELEKIFGTRYAHKVFKDNTVSEALAKLQAYEQKQKEDTEIVEDDVVKCGSHVGIVTRTHKEGKSAWVTWDDGTSGVTSMEVLTKTGKHYGIVQLIAKMKEG